MCLYILLVFRLTKTGRTSFIKVAAVGYFRGVGCLRVNMTSQLVKECRNVSGAAISLFLWMVEYSGGRLTSLVLLATKKNL